MKLLSKYYFSTDYFVRCCERFTLETTGIFFISFFIIEDYNKGIRVNKQVLWQNNHVQKQTLLSTPTIYSSPSLMIRAAGTRLTREVTVAKTIPARAVSRSSPLNCDETPSPRASAKTEKKPPKANRKLAAPLCVPSTATKVVNMTIITLADKL